MSYNKIKPLLYSPTANQVYKREPYKMAPLLSVFTAVETTLFHEVALGVSSTRSRTRRSARPSRNPSRLFLDFDLELAALRWVDPDVLATDREREFVVATEFVRETLEDIRDHVPIERPLGFVLCGHDSIRVSGAIPQSTAVLAGGSYFGLAHATQLWQVSLLSSSARSGCARPTLW